MAGVTKGGLRGPTAGETGAASRNRLGSSMGSGITLARQLKIDNDNRAMDFYDKNLKGILEQNGGDMAATAQAHPNLISQYLSFTMSPEEAQTQALALADGQTSPKGEDYLARQDVGQLRFLIEEDLEDPALMPFYNEARATGDYTKLAEIFRSGEMSANDMTLIEAVVNAAPRPTIANQYKRGTFSQASEPSMDLGNYKPKLDLANYNSSPEYAPGLGNPSLGGAVPAYNGGLNNPALGGGISQGTQQGSYLQQLEAAKQAQIKAQMQAQWLEQQKLQSYMPPSAGSYPYGNQPVMAGGGPPRPQQGGGIFPNNPQASLQAYDQVTGEKHMPTMVSDAEFVMNPQAVKAAGPLLEAINNLYPNPAAPIAPESIPMGQGMAPAMAMGGQAPDMYRQPIGDGNSRVRADRAMGQRGQDPLSGLLMSFLTKGISNLANGSNRGKASNGAGSYPYGNQPVAARGGMPVKAGGGEVADPLTVEQEIQQLLASKAEIEAGPNTNMAHIVMGNIEKRLAEIADIQNLKQAGAVNTPAVTTTVATTPNRGTTSEQFKPSDSAMFNSAVSKAGLDGTPATRATTTDVPATTRRTPTREEVIAFDKMKAELIANGSMSAEKAETIDFNTFIEQGLEASTQTKADALDAGMASAESDSWIGEATNAEPYGRRSTNSEAMPTSFKDRIASGFDKFDAFVKGIAPDGAPKDAGIAAGETAAKNYPSGEFLEGAKEQWQSNYNNVGVQNDLNMWGGEGADTHRISEDTRDTSQGLRQKGVLAQSYSRPLNLAADNDLKSAIPDAIGLFSGDPKQEGTSGASDKMPDETPAEKTKIDVILDKIIDPEEDPLDKKDKAKFHQNITKQNKWASMHPNKDMPAHAMRAQTLLNRFYPDGMDLLEYLGNPEQSQANKIEREKLAQDALQFGEQLDFDKMTLDKQDEWAKMTAAAKTATEDQKDLFPRRYAHYELLLADRKDTLEQIAKAGGLAPDSEEVWNEYYKNAGTNTALQNNFNQLAEYQTQFVGMPLVKYEKTLETTPHWWLHKNWEERIAANNNSYKYAPTGGLNESGTSTSADVARGSSAGSIIQQAEQDNGGYGN